MVSFSKTATWRYPPPWQVCQSIFQLSRTGHVWFCMGFVVQDGSNWSLRKWTLHNARYIPTLKFQVSTLTQKPQRKTRQQKQHARQKDLGKKSICIGHLSLKIPQHVQMKAWQIFYIKKEIAQAKLENAVCSVAGESVYTKHMNSALPLWTALFLCLTAAFHFHSVWNCAPSTERGITTINFSPKKKKKS